MDSGPTSETNTVRTFFLRAKHWQIFLLVFGVEIVGGFLAFGLQVTITHSPEDIFKSSWLFALPMFLSTACLLAWFWATASYFNSIAPPSLKLLRLYVTDQHGRRLTRLRSMSRNLAKLISSLTLGIGFVLCAFTAKKRALHDLLAGCLVSRRRDSWLGSSAQFCCP